MTHECSGEAASSWTKEPSKKKSSGKQKKTHLTILDSWYFTSLLLSFHLLEASYVILERFWTFPLCNTTRRTTCSISGSYTALLPISCDIGGKISKPSTQCSVAHHYAEFCKNLLRASWLGLPNICNLVLCKEELVACFYYWLSIPSSAASVHALVELQYMVQLPLVGCLFLG